MITQNFGDVAQAKRTLDIYTSAVLRESFVKHVEPTEVWRAEMDILSKISCDAYRQLVRHEPR
jgi:phosphoenolpyruvate carboxylase